MLKAQPLVSGSSPGVNLPILLNHEAAHASNVAGTITAARFNEGSAHR